MADFVLLENALANWLWSNANDLLVINRKDKWPDFELRSPGGERLFLELKSKPPSLNLLSYWEKKLNAQSDSSIRFILITPDEPSSKQAERFQSAFARFSGKAQWISLDRLPAILDKPSPGSWQSPRTWSALQTSALVEGLDSYSSAPINPDPYNATPPISELETLTRQFSYETIARLNGSLESLEALLGLGARKENVTIVLSDLVNFSSLVTASRPDDLKQAMGQYYRQARQAVFDHNGMLDKFIGDAVLAIFGYPFTDPDAPCNAIRFAQELTAIGEDVISSWQAELNADIESGTRIGIATGDIWPLNIGSSGIEITLLGDTINLAARLEKNCEPNKLLMDNRTHTAAVRQCPDFISALKLQQKTISPSDAKGQAFDIRAWALL